VGDAVSDIKDVSDEDLAAEVARRKAISYSERPLKRTIPKLDGLLSTIDSGIDLQIAEQAEDDDFVHYVYEAAMEAVFEDYFKWHNSRPWNQ
jgi:hypothetical protein